VTSEPIHLYDLPRGELLRRLGQSGFAAVHAARVWRHLYREHAASLDDVRELPRPLLARLQAGASLAPLRVCEEIASSDGFTTKYLLGLADGERIETVLMRFRGRTTACLSSQVGCALGCPFCATGQLGFTRNLSAGEIVAQAVHVARASTALLKGTAPLRNIVLMGMGEPLQNYDAVMQALDVLCDPGGLAIGYKQVTLSTVGVVPGIYRLAQERGPYSLAVSLHAATQAERLAMLPVARAWPLAELMAACRYYTSKLDRKIFFEWTLIDGVNDSAQQAQALGELLRGMPAQVNLIPLNPTPGYLPGASRPATVQQFQAALQTFGIPSTIRQRRGIDIAAGCGQLAGDVR
jgi:23S rRNA (adenine2503-C2)-methyltransferase